jgi:predicted RND superfamily exporter protein
MHGSHENDGRLSLSFGAERLGLVALRWPVATALVLLAVTVAALFGITKLRVDDSLSELFRSESAEFKAYETLSRRFPSAEYDVLVVVEGPTLLERGSLEALRNAVLELQFIEAKRGLISMFDAREAPTPDVTPGPLFPAELPEGAEFDALIDRVRANEIINGKLLSEDGSLALIVIALKPEIVSSAGLKQVVGEIAETAKRELEPQGLKVTMSGAPVMQLEIRNAVERDSLLYNGLGFLAGAGIAILFFRRFSLMAIAAAPPIIAIIWSLGLFGWIGFKLNLFLNVMSPLIMVLAFSDSMQLTVAMRERLLAGDSVSQAIRSAVLVVGPARVIATATAAVSFFVLIFADSALIETFGIAGALSTALAYIASILFVPLLSLALIREGSIAPAEGGQRFDGAMGALKRICAVLASNSVRRPGLTVVVGVALALLFGGAYASLDPRYRLADQVPDREQALSASESLDAKLTGSNPIDVMIEWPRDLGLYDSRVIDAIGAIHAVVEQQSGIGNVWSIETLRRWVAQRGDASPSVLKSYVDVLPEYLTQRFIAPQEQSAVVSGRTRDIDASELLPLVNRLEKALEPVRERHPEMSIAVSGLSAIAARNSAEMIGKLSAGLTFEILFISAFMGLAFRSVLVGLASVVPNIFPVMTAGALLAVTGAGLQFASIVALTVAFGLGLNATVHYFNRLRLETRTGEDLAAGVERATVLIGPALILTSLVLAFGLGVTMLSDLPSLRVFGQVAAVTLIAALVGDLIFLPAIVLLLRRAARRLGFGGEGRPARGAA